MGAGASKSNAASNASTSGDGSLRVHTGNLSLAVGNTHSGIPPNMVDKVLSNDEKRAEADKIRANALNSAVLSFPIAVFASIAVVSFVAHRKCASFCECSGRM